MNLSGILDLFDDLPAYRQVMAGQAAGEGPGALNLFEPARPPMLAKLFADTGRPILLLTGRVDSVPAWQQALEAWLPGNVGLFRFPEPTPLPYERGPWSQLSRNRRLGVLAKLMETQHPFLPTRQEPYFVISSARALLHKTLPRRRFVAMTRTVRMGQIIDMEKLVGDWMAAGYVHVSVVEAEGQFSRRGGILDIFPVGAAHPTRIELFGDEVETLRAFNPSTQRSGGTYEESRAQIMIPPARELLPGDAQAVGQKLAADYGLEGGDLPGWRDDIPDLAAGIPSALLEYYLPMVYDEPASLLDYLPADTLLVLDDLPELNKAAAEVISHAEQVAAEKDTQPPGYPSPLFVWPELVEQIAANGPLCLGELVEDKAGQGAVAEMFQQGPRFGGQMRPLLMQLRAALGRQETTVIVSRQAQRLAELWRQERSRDADNGQSDYPVEQVTNRPATGKITFVQGTLSGGFVLIEGAEGVGPEAGRRERVRLNLFSDAEIFGWSRPVPRRRSRPRRVAPETFFSDITPGDFVVHLEFGIGRFIGLVIRAIGGMNREYLQVNFANSDVLYVPVHHADRLSRWIGPDDRSPKMHRLGEKTWRSAKEKARKAVDELAEDLLELYAARETIAGHGFAKDGQWQNELEASFSYRETEDQLQAIAEVKGDMERPYPMDRLICGDVGYGKTEVALRAAFKAVLDGKQVAMLVPTTVLAQQHYNTFQQRLRPFPVEVEMLSRFRTHAQQETIVKRLREGQLDVVIGTHRLFSDDVSFKDLGLLIIDEEQRFGVAHKEKLKQLRTEVDVLTLTATPIPRTLYMGLAGVRDISLIDTAPSDRLPVQSYVGESEDSLLRRAVLRELDRGGQVFYVHNRVQTIGNAYLKLSYLVPEAAIGIAHGQMSERELEEVMIQFVNGEVDVLLTTTIIESGLDIPNANTLIVERADRFGLAQLYQLRGRIGRGNRRAFAYFLHPAWHNLTADAKARLDVIAAQTELGAGYTIALRDLEIRGAGDLLGSRQSGHVAAVGFDLYTRLLAQAVKRRKSAKRGEKAQIEPPESILIDLPLAAYIPTDYVPESSLRLRLYRRMAVLDSLEEIDDMAAELADRFGPIPDPVDNLLYQLRIKVLAQKAGISGVATESGQVLIRIAKANGEYQPAWQTALGPGVRVSRKGIWLGRGLTTREWQVSLVQILEQLQVLSEGEEKPPTKTRG